MEQYFKVNSPCFFFTIGHIRISGIQSYLGYEIRLGPNMLFGKKETGKTTMLDIISGTFPLKRTNGKFMAEKENELSTARLIQELTRQREYILFDQPRLQEHPDLIDSLYEKAVRATTKSATDMSVKTSITMNLGDYVQSLNRFNDSQLTKGMNIFLDI